MKFDGREYELQMSSSPPDDGTLLELIDGPREHYAENVGKTSVRIVPVEVKSRPKLPRRAAS